MSFQNPLWLVAAAALLAGFLFKKRIPRGDDWYRIISAEVLEFLVGVKQSTSRRSGALLLAAIAAIALADPSVPVESTNTFRHSEGWFVLADVSRSMTLEDVAPSRLSAMRDIATRVAEQTGSRPLSLIIYAGDAFMITPPAFDIHHFTSNAALLDHGLVPVEGSNLTRALSLVSSVIDSSNMLSARVFILGDTGGINAKAQAAVAHLARQGHTTDVIVIGSEDSSANAGFDLGAADKLAEAGNGTMIESDIVGQFDMEKLDLERVHNKERSLVQSGIALLRLDSLSHWVLLPGLLLMLLLFRQERV